MKHLSLPVESVRERDIDFLLVEEFLSSGEFINFFTSALDLPGCDAIIKVERSINSFGLGETDVFVEYQHGESRIGLFIENKLDAFFQPEQAQRYTARAELHQTAGDYDFTLVALVAPQQYIDKQIDFDLCVSYEQLIDYFESTNLKARGEFKATLLKIAAEKLRRGYVAINSEPNQAFWLAYREQLATALPEVFMKPVAVVPAGSDWIDLSIGKRIFVHKLNKGYLDFSKLNEDVTLKLENAFGERSENLTFKSGNILRISTTPLNRMEPLREQSAEFKECVEDLQIIRTVLFTK